MLCAPFSRPSKRRTPSRHRSVKAKLRRYDQNARRPSAVEQATPLRSSHKGYGILRRFTLLWKRLTRPSRPRQSRRFSFVPPGFDIVPVGKKNRAKSTMSLRKRRARRNGMIFDAPPMFLQNLETVHDNNVQQD
ncbi:hypothetical protein CPB85DRAFT_1428600 [Mucidula mucida]|nr:hypothetical protein CPB85DRAFT_1428600 [Mucidula mucida]